MTTRVLTMDLDTNRLAGRVQAVLPGREVGRAETKTQYNFAGEWTEVPGLTLMVTSLIPVYMFANLGTLVLATTARATVEQRIIDRNTSEVIAYATSSISGDPSGFDSLYLPVISGRIPAGSVGRDLLVQVKSASGKPTYITPAFLDGATSSFYAIGA